MALYQASKIRGLHSFGFAATNGATLALQKFDRLDLLQACLSSLAGYPVALIGHNRYSTSGDWREPDNNQPLMKDRILLAFNGVIDMRPPADWVKNYGGDFETQNDGEIFLNWLRDRKNPVAFLKKYPCSFAGLFMSNSQVWALRNDNRPLWYLEINQSIFVASTNDIFKRALGANTKPMPLLPLKILSLQTGKYCA